MYRLFSQKLFGAAPQTDEQGYLRLDDLEMRGLRRRIEQGRARLRPVPAP